QKTHPQVDIVIRDQLSGTLYQAMRERQIDMALTTPPEEDGFDFEPLLEDPLVMVVQKDGPLDDGRPVRWSVFADHPFIALSPSSSVRKLSDTALATSGVIVRPLYDCAQLTTVRALIAEGLGITALPRSAVMMLQPGPLSFR